MRSESMETTKQLVASIQAFAAQNDLLLAVRYANSSAKSFFQTYYLTKEREIASMIDNLEMKRRFEDYRTGYRAKMEEWLGKEGNNPIKDASLFFEEPRNKNQYLLILVLGTLISITVFFIGKQRFWWLSLLCEALVLLLSYWQYSLDHKMKVGNVLGVQGITSAVQEWIKTAESYSDSILEEYGINMK